MGGCVADPRRRSPVRQRSRQGSGPERRTLPASPVDPRILDHRCAADPDRPSLIVRRRRGKRWASESTSFGAKFTTKLLPGFSLLIDPRRQTHIAAVLMTLSPRLSSPRCRAARTGASAASAPGSSCATAISSRTATPGSTRSPSRRATADTAQAVADAARIPARPRHDRRPARRSARSRSRRRGAAGRAAGRSIRSAAEQQGHVSRHPRPEAAGAVGAPRPRTSSKLLRATRASCWPSTRTCGTTSRCGPLKDLLNRGWLGEPVLATIDMRADAALDAVGRGAAVALDVRHEHPPPRHVPLLARHAGPRAGQHPARSADEVPARATASTCTSSNTTAAPGPSWDDVWAGPCKRGRGRATSASAGGSRGRTGWHGHDRLAEATRRGRRARSTSRTRRQPGYVAPAALGRGLVPRRLRRHDGSAARRGGGRHRAGDQRPRQPRNDRPVRGGVRRGEASTA